MSEVTTGAVGLSSIGAPVAVGIACVNALSYVAKYCNNKYKDMLQDIQATDDKLKWMDKQQYSSPIHLASEARRLKQMVFTNELFTAMTSGLSVLQKEVLAIAIASENSPIKTFMPEYLSQMEIGKVTMEEVIKNSVHDLAVHNFNKVADVVADAASVAGFSSNTQVITKSKNVLDLVFTDDKNRKFTAFIKLNKELNPSLSLDLEGFACNVNDCSNKMDEIVKYLNSHGIPFEYKTLKHNQPNGVLRKLIQKMNKPSDKSISDYLTATNQDYLTSNKLK